MIVLGTRPEAVKLAPVAAALRARPEMRIVVVTTGQHAHMVAPVARVLGLSIDHDLAIMSHGQSLNQIVSRTIDGLDALITEELPEMIIVQGDTSTAMAAALAGFNRNVAIAHVEAGLRTGDMTSPWPEEANRVLIGRLATLHFAPTKMAAANLIAEGVADGDVHMVGNTVVDAAHLAAKLARNEASETGAPMILVTSHRRESIGEPMENAFRGIVEAVEGRDVRVLFPVHPNPRVQRIAQRVMGWTPNIEMVAPLDYDDLVTALRRCHFVVTDSGGIVEEAAAFGKPALVLRESTERTESIDSGGAELVGTNSDRVRDRIVALLEDHDLHRTMSNAPNPYGDGKSSERIAEALLARFAQAIVRDEARAIAKV